MGQSNQPSRTRRHSIEAAELNNHQISLLEKSHGGIDVVARPTHTLSISYVHATIKANRCRLPCSCVYMTPIDQQALQ